MTPFESQLAPIAPFLCPEMKLWLLPPEAPSWHASQLHDFEMPYWAFAWPGGQALARYLLDCPEIVSGKRVLDFGCGCAIEGVAAAKAGASVLCTDIGTFAVQWAARNAQLNSVNLEVREQDVLGQRLDVDVILVGDVCCSEIRCEFLMC